MLFPEDPSRRTQLWEALQIQLARDEVSLIVDRGVGNPVAAVRKLANIESKELIERMQKAAICRISANHGNAIGPHFSGAIDDKCITITDFIAAPSKLPPRKMLDQIQRDFESAALNLLYGPNPFEAVQVPIKLSTWYSEDLEISKISGGLAFTKSR